MKTAEQIFDKHLPNDGQPYEYPWIIAAMEEYAQQYASQQSSTAGVLIDHNNFTDEQCLKASGIVGGASHLSHDSQIFQFRELMKEGFYRQTNIPGNNWFKLYEYLQSLSPVSASVEGKEESKVDASVEKMAETAALKAYPPDMQIPNTCRSRNLEDFNAGDRNIFKEGFISGYTSRQEGGWVSVEDGLPEVAENQPYQRVIMVCHDWAIGPLAMFGIYCKQNFYGAELWWSDGDDAPPMTDSVTHWMYIPSSPDKTNAK